MKMNEEYLATSFFLSNLAAPTEKIHSHKMYHENGNLWIEKNVRFRTTFNGYSVMGSTAIHGNYSEYYRSGNLMKKGKYVDNLKEGKWISGSYTNKWFMYSFLSGGEIEGEVMEFDYEK